MSAPQNETEQYFRKITELSDAEAFFAEAAKEKELGFFLVEEKDRLLGVSVSFGEKNTVFLAAEGFLTEDYLFSKLKGLLDAGACGITFSLKPQLHMLPVREEKTSEERAKAFFDTEIAAYLLNPLKWRIFL